MAGRKDVAAAAEASARSSLAVATLLRLADADLRDAAVLESGRDPGNAPALAGRAVARMIDAVVVTEMGWTRSAKGDLDRVPDQNPLKRSLAGVSSLLPPALPPVPLDDGRAPSAPDRDTLSKGMLAATALLKDLAARFEIDLFGNGPAGRIVPVRPKPTPPPRQPSKPPVFERAPPTPVLAPAKPEPASKPAKAPSKRSTTIQATRRREHPVQPLPAAEPHEVEERSPIEARPRRGSISSTAFWSLMDKWRVPDAQALDLIGHPGGLTKKGTRPRFKLTGDEVEMLRGLQEIDAALVPLKLDAARGFYEPVKEVPFEGATPLAFLVQTRLAGVRETIRFIVRHGLKMSMSR